MTLQGAECDVCILLRASVHSLKVYRLQNSLESEFISSAHISV